MATVNIGNIKFNWKGAWDSSTTYAVDDVVSHSGSSYVSIQAGSNQNPASASSYWEQMSSAGTNGTDLTSTLTTRGDIVFKGASALERLPKGTAGYYLKQGANDPEWSELSGGDVVKLVSGTHSGTELTLDNLFTADYPLYKIHLYDVKTPNNWLGMRARTGGSSGNTIGANEYRFKSLMTYRTSGNSGAETAENGWGAGEFRIGWTNQQNSEKPQAFEITIAEPMSTATKFTYGMLNTFVNDDYIGHAHGAGTLDRTASEVYTGLIFHQNGGNSWTGKYVVYGLKI